MKTRIALVSPYTLPFYCGNSFLAERLREGLTKRGFQVALFNSGKDNVKDAIDFAPDVVHSLNADRPHQWLQKLQDQHVGPWVITLTGTDYNAWCGVKEPPPQIRQSLEDADALVVFHQEAYDDLRSCLPAIRDKLHIVPQGVTPLGQVSAPDGLRRQSGIDPDSVLFLMVASLRPVKNLTMAIEAFLAVEKDAPIARLLLMGPILDEKESTRILRLGNELKCFTYLGERPPDEVRRYMQAADVFLNTSLNEGMPGAVLEAMAEGLPVLASDVTGNRTLVVHEKNGLLFPVADVRALTDSALRLVRDETLRKRLGRAGSAMAASHYSVEREVEGYRRIYEELLLTALPTKRHVHPQPLPT